jgi:hypothetical protein
MHRPLHDDPQSDEEMQDKDGCSIDARFVSATSSRTLTKSVLLTVAAFVLVALGLVHAGDISAKIRDTVSFQHTKSDENGRRLVVVHSLGEGMSAWPFTLMKVLALAASTNHSVPVPCLSFEGQVRGCKGNASDILLTDVFNLSGLGFLDSFVGYRDFQPDIRLWMQGMPHPTFTHEKSLQGNAPRTLDEWKGNGTISSANSIEIHRATWDWIKFNNTFMEHIDGGQHEDKYPMQADSFPQFNFSESMEAEAARILKASGLVPSTPGKEGNYVVYHWRSEAVNGVNYTECAEHLLAHVAARYGKSKRLVLVSDMPFNVSALPSLWAVNTAKNLAKRPTIPIARDLLIDAGFTKLEVMAAKAGVNLSENSLARLSAWDAIFARGGSSLTLCRTPECRKCSRTKSKFMSLIRYHYLKHHGSNASIEYSWMHLEH